MKARGALSLICLVVGAGCSGNVLKEPLPSVAAVSEWKAIAAKLPPQDAADFEGYMVTLNSEPSNCMPPGEAKTVEDAIAKQRIAVGRREMAVERVRPRFEQALALAKSKPESDVFFVNMQKATSDMKLARDCDSE